MDITPLFEDPAELDEEALDEPIRGVVVDHEVRSLGRENRLGLATGSISWHTAVDGAGLCHVPLVFVAHPHPECRLDWARLLIDLAPSQPAEIAAMVPDHVEGDEPVEIETTVNTTGTFGVVIDRLGVDLSRERRMKQNVYFPQIISSGVGFTTGYWDFRATRFEFLYSNRILHLLAKTPAIGDSLVADITIRASIHQTGWRRSLPFIVKRPAVALRHTLASPEATA